MSKLNSKVAVESSPLFAIGVWKYVFIFVIVGFMLAYSGLVIGIGHMDTNDGYEMLNEEKDISHVIINNTEIVKYILLWNTYFGDPSYNLDKTIGSSWNSSSGFSQMNCAASFSTSCQLTANRSLLPYTSQFDAVVFHERDFSWKDVPEEERRSRSQMYVFTSYEAPVWGNRRKEKMKRMQGFFNWSMTYRRASTFYTPYGGFIKTRDHPLGTELDTFIKKFGEKNKNVAQKQNSAASIVQIVSNCKSHSKREELVKSMQKLIPVDIYGACGTIECPRSGGGGDAGWKCYQMMDKRYKFYLAWENAFCKDYVTEKFFEIAKYDIIPVVLNGAEMDQIAPKHSYITLQDFKNMSELIRYLQRVEMHDKLFASYFWWRDFYSVQDRHISRHKSWCSLCSALLKDKEKDWNQEHLLLVDAGYHINEATSDLNNFWVKEADCKHFLF